MPVFNNMTELFAYLQANISESLQDQVFEEVRDVEQKHIDGDVYDSYIPQMYVSRDINDGLIADKNIVGEMIDTSTLAVKNVAKPNVSITMPPTDYKPVTGTEFASWIEEGSVPNLWDENTYPWNSPRRFTENTRDDLERSKRHVYALKKGLKARGIDSK